MQACIVNHRDQLMLLILNYFNLLVGRLVAVELYEFFRVKQSEVMLQLASQRYHLCLRLVTYHFKLTNKTNMN